MSEIDDREEYLPAVKRPDPDCEACGGEGDLTCQYCNGSGEGFCDGDYCSRCNGRGVIACACTRDD